MANKAVYIGNNGIKQYIVNTIAYNSDITSFGENSYFSSPTNFMINSGFSYPIYYTTSSSTSATPAILLRSASSTVFAPSSASTYTFPSKIYLKAVKTTIKFNANGGTGGPSDSYGICGLKVPDFSSILVPTRTNYTFGGYYNSTLTICYYNSSGIGLLVVDSSWATETTVYAKWIPNTYTVTLDQLGATTEGTKSVSASYGNAMPSITIPQKTDYLFKGYFLQTGGKGTKYYNANGSSAHIWDIASNTTLYAYWELNVVTAKFYDYSGSSKYTSISGAPNSSQSAPSAPSARTGYNFSNYWKLSVSPYTTVYLNSTFNLGTADLTYYGQWSKEKYTVTYTSSKGYTPGSETWEYNTSHTLPGYNSCGEVTGYSLYKWSGNGGTFDPGSSTSVKANTTFNAIWQAKTYNIYFDANEHGTNPPSTISKKYDESVTLPTEKPTANTGYKFLGWTLNKEKADRGEFDYNPGDTFAETISNDTKLYAAWELITYKYILKVATRFKDETIKAFINIEKQVKSTTAEFNIKTEIVPLLKRPSCELTSIIDSDGTVYKITDLKDTDKITIEAKDNETEQTKTIKSTWNVNIPEFYWSNDYTDLQHIIVGSDELDDEIFKNKNSSDLTAILWNNFNYQVQLLAGGSSAYIYTPAVSGKPITAETYNHAAAKLKELDEEDDGICNPFKNYVEIGEKIKLSYLNNGEEGLYSLKEEANAVREELYS